MFPALIEKLTRREDLTVDEASAAMAEMMEGRAAPVQIAGLLIGLAMKGERPAEIVGLPIKAARARARDLLNLVGLAGYEDKYPQQLSGGMQQRTAIARAFIHDPKLILMDEPFGALDALTREQMNLEMLRIWRESGKTIIFVTHSIQEAVFLGSHCAVLTAGPARMAEYFAIDLPFPRALPIKTTDEFGAYARRIYASLGLGSGS